jgi:hypothetical protein
MGRTRRRRGGDGEEKSALTSLYEWGASALGVIKKPASERANDKIKTGLDNTKSIFMKEKEAAESELNKTDSVSKKDELRVQLENLADTNSKIDALIEAFKHIFNEPAMSPGQEPLPVDNLTPLSTPVLPPTTTPSLSPDYGVDTTSPDLNNMAPDLNMQQNDLLNMQQNDLNNPVDMTDYNNNMAQDFSGPNDMSLYGNNADKSMYEGGSRRLARRRKRRSVRLRR